MADVLVRATVGGIKPGSEVKSSRPDAPSEMIDKKFLSHRRRKSREILFFESTPNDDIDAAVQFRQVQIAWHPPFPIVSEIDRSVLVPNLPPLFFRRNPVPLIIRQVDNRPTTCLKQSAFADRDAIETVSNGCWGRKRLMLLPRLGQSRDRDGENIRFVRPEASVDQVRRP